MTQVLGIGALLLLSLPSASPHCTQHGLCQTYDYLPAPPGHTPSCARPGSTYCEIVDHYPRRLIRYLVEKLSYDFSTLLGDESSDEFYDRKPSTYDPSLHNVYGPPPSVHSVYGPFRSQIEASISYGPINITSNVGGYPNRRYKIEPHFFINALQQPSDHNPNRSKLDKRNPYFFGRIVSEPSIRNLQSVQWWKRYKRSGGKSSRRKRQAPPGSTTLCPTQAAYILPRAALNINGNWMYTVNVNDVNARFTQLVRSETCTSTQCNGLCSLPNGYSSRCQQQYVQKRLVALESNGDRLYSDVFWFPHCCVCQITPNFG